MKLTWDKYHEAEYFLNQMRNSTQEINPFRYNLNAFLTAGRSITLILQKEYRSKDEYKSAFDKWYEAKQREMDEANLLNFFKRNRNYVLKEGPADLRYSVSNRAGVGLPLEIEGWDEQVDIGDGSNLTFNIPAHEAPAVSIADDDFGTDLEHKYYFADMRDEIGVSDEITGAPVIQVCEQYLEMIEGMLSEWEDQLNSA